MDSFFFYFYSDVLISQMLLNKQQHKNKLVDKPKIENIGLHYLLCIFMTDKLLKLDVFKYMFVQ